MTVKCANRLSKMTCAKVKVQGDKAPDSCQTNEVTKGENRRRSNTDQMNKKDSLSNYLKWSADEVKAVEEFQAKLDAKLLEVMRTGNFSYQDMYRLLEPFISDYTFLYKIRIGKNALNRADNRHVTG